jgi:hypothetical protein
MSGEENFIYKSLGASPSEVALPAEAPDFVLVEGECYQRTNEKVLPNDIRTDYSGDFADCDSCLLIHETPTKTLTPTVTLTATPAETPTLTLAMTPTLTLAMTPTLTPPAITPTPSLTPELPPNSTPTLTPFNISSPCSNPASSSISFSDERISHFFNSISCLWSYDDQKFLDDNAAAFQPSVPACHIGGFQYLSTAVMFAFKQGISVDEQWVRNSSFGGVGGAIGCPDGGLLKYSGSIPLQFPINPHEFSIPEIGSEVLTSSLFSPPGNQLSTVLSIGQMGSESSSNGTHWSIVAWYFSNTLVNGNNWEIMNEAYTQFFDEFKV